MARQVLLVSAFLLFLNVSVVLCREDYYQHFSNQFSHYHRKSTPDDNVSSTEASVPPSEEPSVSGLPHETALKSTGESGGKQHGVSPTYNSPLAFKTTGDRYGPQYESSSYSYYDYNQTVLVTRIVIIVGCVAFFLISLAVIVCCRPACCRGRQTAGYIIRDNTTQVVTQPQQLGPASPVMHTTFPTQQLPSYPPGYTLPSVQQHPAEQPQFQTSQQQYQYSPLQQQYHNPAAVPPPYSEKY